MYSRIAWNTQMKIADFSLETKAIRELIKIAAPFFPNNIVAERSLSTLWPSFQSKKHD